MRVLILTSNPASASARYRVLQYVPALEAAGATARVEAIPRHPARRRRLFAEARKYEVTLLQKRLFWGWQLRPLRRAARRLIYDFDDAVCFRDSSRRNPRSLARALKFRAVVSRADLVIAGNAYLGDLAARHAREVVVVPTALDPAKYDEAAGRRRREGPVKLGWIGSGSNLPYLEALADPLRRVAAERDGVLLKVVCDRFPTLDGVEVEETIWSEGAEADDVADMDVGLAPSADDPWTRGKCGLKTLQYFAASLPVVASPVGVLNEMVRDDETGFPARDADEWADRLLRLIDNRDLRRRLGGQARRSLDGSYTLEATAPAFVRAVLGESASGL